MAVSIDQLPLAGSLQPTDKLLVQQAAQAKALQTEVLKQWLLEVAQSLGGFSKPVELIGTNGLVDTYQFTYVDGTTSTFTLRNGSSIDYISLLSTTGLVDTYKVWLTDGTFTTFKVKNARSITSIEQLPSSGEGTILKINFNEGSPTQFTIPKGKDGNSSYVQIAYADRRPDESHSTIRQSPAGPWMGVRVAVVGSGLVPSFNSDYRVYEWSNIKGAPGDQGYVWIKYATSKPTAERPEFGDIPDRWMGVAYGPDSVAPDDWRKYQWYDRGGIKGDPGQDGSSITKVTSKNSYINSDSNTVIPQGVWFDTIPEPHSAYPYLWQRTTLSFQGSKGEKIPGVAELYSVSDRSKPTHLAREFLGVSRTSWKETGSPGSYDHYTAEVLLPQNNNYLNSRVILHPMPSSVPEFSRCQVGYASKANGLIVSLYAIESPASLALDALIFYGGGAL